MSVDRYFYLWIKLARVRGALYKVREQELKPYALKPEHSLIFFMVKTLKNKATPAEIARQTFRRPHTVSVVINRLVKLGLLSKKNNPKQKNSVIISLTPEGERIYRHARKRKSMIKVISRLSQKEYDQLERCLDVLLKAGGEELGVGHIPILPELNNYNKGEKK